MRAWWRRVYGQYKLHRALHHLYIEMKLYIELEKYKDPCPANVQRRKAVFDAAEIILHLIGISPEYRSKHCQLDKDLEIR
jgi:hypothetical protein